MKRILFIALAFSLANAAPAQSRWEYLGAGSLPGNLRDRSGLKGRDKLGVPSDRLGGMGSAIDYTGSGDTYILASDRGPGDGASDFRCRIHRMEIIVRPGGREPVSIRLLSTTLLSDMAGQPLTGAKKPGLFRFDPEGIRMGRGGRFYISDEYGPVVAEFSPEGTLIRRFPVPGRYLPQRESENPQEELPPGNNQGRQPNRGMEGLAISPDGNTLYGIMQSPLIPDGAVDGTGKRQGLNCRLLALDTRSGSTREFVYQLDDPAHGLSEILAAGPDSFLVIERDSLKGADARAKRIYRCDLGRATDVSGIERLPAGQLPKEIVPMGKELLIDLLDPRLGLAGPGFPEKIEGLAFGPDLPGGRKLLLVTADNDFVAEAPFRVFAFALPSGSAGN